MPLYDYRCQECHKRFTMMVGVVAEARALACPACGSEKLTRLIGRFGSPRSEDQMLEDLSDIDRVGDMEDPKQLKRWMKEMGKAMHEDMGEEFEQMLKEEASGDAV